MLGLAVTMPQTTSLSSVAAAVPNSEGTKAEGVEVVIDATQPGMPMTFPQVSTRYRSLPSPSAQA
jgi:hypothetical protein